MWIHRDERWPLEVSILGSGGRRLGHVIGLWHLPDGLDTQPPRGFSRSLLQVEAYGTQATAL